MTAESTGITDESVIEKYLVPPNKLLISDRRFELGYSELGKYKLYIERKVEFIAKPTTVTFSSNGIVLTFPNGIKATLGYGHVKHSAEEFYRLVRTNLKWVVVLAKKPTVIDYDEVMPEPAYDVADNILQHSVPAEALIAGLGYVIKPEVMWLMIPRLLPLVKTPRPIHVWQFTKYNTGKTEVGLMFMKLFNFFYSTSVPTEAGLTYDARTGTYGMALVSEGVVFDEVDKWSTTKIMQENLMSFLPTLMEQGAVIRPTTRRTFIGLIERRIPFMFMGNIQSSIKDRSVTDRERLKVFLESWGDLVGAVADRIAVTDFVDEEIYISDYVSGKVLPESVMMALVDLVNKDVRKLSIPEPSALRGRLKRHAEMLYIALTALGLDVRMEWCDAIVVNGFWEFMRNIGGRYV